MRRSHIYTRGRCAPGTPLADKFSYLKRILGPVETCVEFQLSTSSSFRDIRGPKFTLAGAPPHIPLAENFSYVKRVLGPVELSLKFQLYSSSSFRAMRGPKFTLGGVAPPAQP